MKKRYERNMAALTAAENERLREFKVCVIGCGGLGGYVIEHLARLGIGHITAVDGDVFEESNLNRQILSDETVLGLNKAVVAEERIKKVNSDVRLTAINEYITEKNSETILSGHDVVVDALDNIHARILIGEAAQKLGIPIIHGAIAGWYGQVCVIAPGVPIYDKLYHGSTEEGMESVLGNLPFTAAVIAAIQASEAVKVLLGREDALSGRLLTVDLIQNEYIIYEL
ncbi:MAG: HesA/MoeB/ThiF family protein [Oscillospiraceae bacterium]|nr:HesA/MoeB/ThiF family protein [Oscillospiraceae bacterium]